MLGRAQEDCGRSFLAVNHSPGGSEVSGWFLVARHKLIFSGSQSGLGVTSRLDGTP